MLTKFRISWFIAIFTLLSLQRVFAESDHKETYLSSFHAKFKKAVEAASSYDNFSVAFNEEFYSVLRDKVTISKGTLDVLKPNSFRFEITSPYPELYVTDGDNFWKYNSEFQHAQHLPAYTGELNFLSILMDLSTLKKFYKISPWTDEDATKLNQSDSLPQIMSDKPASQKNGNILLKLEPKGDNQQKVLYAIIQVTTGFIQELRIVQINGNRTRFVFSGYSQDPVPPEKFHFQPPDGVVVDELDNVKQ